MAGHSKWKTIKHKKAAADQKRGRLFTKLLKEITVAAKVGGGDPTGNPRLRFLLEKARNVNMPLENAQRAIKKGLGELPGQHYESYTYEGYGPGGIAVMVEVLTDNKNRAIAELRHAFSRGGGTIADSGAVNWMFAHRGVVRAQGKIVTEDELIELLLDFPVDTIEIIDDSCVVVCEPKALDEIRQALVKESFAVDEAKLEWVAKNKIELASETEEKAVAFLQALDDLEDVQDVFTTLS